jgi:hypothetical protein
MKAIGYGIQSLSVETAAGRRLACPGASSSDATTIRV